MWSKAERIETGFFQLQSPVCFLYDRWGYAILIRDWTELSYGAASTRNDEKQNANWIKKTT